MCSIPGGLLILQDEATPHKMLSVWLEHPRAQPRCSSQRVVVGKPEPLDSMAKDQSIRRVWSVWLLCLLLCELTSDLSFFVGRGGIGLGRITFYLWGVGDSGDILHIKLHGCHLFLLCQAPSALSQWFSRWLFQNS